MTSLPAKQGSSRVGPASAAARVGHVYLDVRRRLLYFLNARAKQLHEEGVPFVRRDLAHSSAQKLTGEPITRDDLPLIRALREESPQEVTFVLPRHPEPAFLVTWNTVPLRGSGGQVVGVFGSVAVHQPEPDWQALAGLAHDLRTPLQALKLLVALLESNRPLDDELRAALDRIRTAADRALGIGMDLLAWCRGPNQGGRRAEPDWFALEPFLHDVVSEQSAAAQQKSLHLITELKPARGWEICADRVRLGRLLSNLLVNAVGYTASGTVQFRAEWVGDGPARTLSLCVLDSGAGISPDEQESIFQPFERGRAGKDSDPGGSGLGLAVVERLVEELGLELEVYSEFGRGSAFHLHVPMNLLRRTPSAKETELTRKDDTDEQRAHGQP